MNSIDLHLRPGVMFYFLVKGKVSLVGIRIVESTLVCAARENAGI